MHLPARFFTPTLAVCARVAGTVGESQDLARVQAKTGTVLAPRGAKMRREIEAAGVVLVGKVDAVEEESGRVVETKRRRNRLFRSVPIYEKVQVMS